MNDSNKQSPGSGQPPLAIDKAAARAFLAFLDPGGFDQHAFQVFDDNKDRSQATKNVSKGRDYRARTLIGPFDQHADTLVTMNRDGCAAHVTINYIAGPQRLEKYVKRIRKHFTEKDDDEPMEAVLARADKMGLTVAWVNESSPGHFHYYWNVARDVEKDVPGFRQRQRLLAAAFGGGRESVDPPRVLRLPGFWHQKGKPFQVRTVYTNPDAPAYGLQDFDLALADVVIPDTSSSTGAAGDIDDTEDDEAIESATAHFKNFPRSITDTETPDGKLNKKGNNTTFDAFAKARDLGVDLETAIRLAAEFYNPRCDPPWSDEELRTIAGNAYRYAKGTKGKDKPSNKARAEFGTDPNKQTDDDKTRDESFTSDPKWKEEGERLKAAEAKRKRKNDARAKWAGENFGLETHDGEKIEPRNVDHIWQDRLARGKHTMFAGEGGKGKSQLAYAIAAMITKAAAWPDAAEIAARMKKVGDDEKDIAAAKKAPLGTVVVFSAEDTREDTMIPRLIAAGAKMSNIKVVSGTRDAKTGLRKFSLQDDLAKLAAYCKSINEAKDDDGEPLFPPVRLIIFDPVSSYMGGAIDASQNVQVRDTLDPISDLADKIGCAIFSITHFNKGTSAKAVNKVMDSAAFVNAPRAVFGAFDDIEDIGSEPGDSPEDSKYLFLLIKTNGQKVGGIRYHIESAIGGIDARTGKPVKTSKVVWDGPTTMTANQVQEIESERGPGGGAPRLREAMSFLQEELRDGPRPTAEVQERAEAENIAEDTLRRARRKLKIKAEKIPGAGMEAKWQWRWSGARDIDTEAAQAAKAAEAAEAPFDDSDFA